MVEYDELVQGWVRDRKIPGAVLDITAKEGFRYCKAYGDYDTGIGARQDFSVDTLFDLASLTKVIATLPAILMLVAEKRLSLDDWVQKYIPAFRHSQISIRHLLNHTSGLPADLPYQPRYMVNRQVIHEICELELVVERPGEYVLYSDLGLILLGHIITIITRERLDHYMNRVLYTPLGMNDTMFRPDEFLRERTAPTEFVDGAYIHGKVHDEKSFHLGSISGSAGLFSTADNVARYARCWLYPDDQTNIPPILMQECLINPKDNRGLGWEIWSGQGRVPSCGIHWSPGSFGHTGFTGTSVWIDPHRELIVVFLTNALYYGRGNSIRELRPLLHDSIYTSLYGV
ncbi:MAG: serine hydrolase domain-containing protein [Paenibacillaceae bacterium]